MGFRECYEIALERSEIQFSVSHDLRQRLTLISYERGASA